MSEKARWGVEGNSDPLPMGSPSAHNATLGAEKQLQRLQRCTIPRRSAVSSRTLHGAPLHPRYPRLTQLYLLGREPRMSQHIRPSREQAGSHPRLPYPRAARLDG